MDVAIENTPLGRGFPHLLYVSHKICCFCPRFHAFRHVGMQQDVNWKESMSLVKRNNNHPLLQAPTFDPRPSVFSGIYISKYLDIYIYIYTEIQLYKYTNRYIAMYKNNPGSDPRVAWPSAGLTVRCHEKSQSGVCCAVVNKSECVQGASMPTATTTTTTAAAAATTTTTTKMETTIEMTARR